MDMLAIRRAIIRLDQARRRARQALAAIERADGSELDDVVSSLGEATYELEAAFGRLWELHEAADDE